MNCWTHQKRKLTVFRPIHAMDMKGYRSFASPWPRLSLLHNLMGLGRSHRSRRIFGWMSNLRASLCFGFLPSKLWNAGHPLRRSNRKNVAFCKAWANQLDWAISCKGMWQNESEIGTFSTRRRAPERSGASKSDCGKLDLAVFSI